MRRIDEASRVGKGEALTFTQVPAAIATHSAELVCFLCFCWAAALVRVLGLTRCLLAWSHYHLRGVGHGGSIIKCWTNLTTAFGKQLQFFSILF